MQKGNTSKLNWKSEFGNCGVQGSQKEKQKKFILLPIGPYTLLPEWLNRISEEKLCESQRCTCVKSAK